MKIKSTKPTAVYLLSTSAYNRIYGASEQADLGSLVQVLSPALTAETWRKYPDMCRQAEIIISGWGMPLVDEAFLEAFPNLKAIFYGAGSIKGFVTEAFWRRNIVISSAYAANAIPVCEFVIAQIVLSSKHLWRLAADTRERCSYADFTNLMSPGLYESVIGLISLGAIGRMVAERLQQFQVEVIAYDPLIDPYEAARLNVELCSLQEVFRRSDVVSCHTPLLKETEEMLTQDLFESMKPGATFINTARGGIVDEAGMIAALKKRTDLWALLDVTSPEPPEPDSPLYKMPNILLTPHIAGSNGRECRRMGRVMIDELACYLAGSPLRYAIQQKDAALMA